MVVGDNGVGFPPDFSLANTNSLGLHLVTVLVQQLEGTLDIHGQDGAQFRITFTIH
jgi:two-component sensor histidine kinase